MSFKGEIGFETSGKKKNCSDNQITICGKRLSKMYNSKQHEKSGIGTDLSGEPIGFRIKQDRDK